MSTYSYNRTASVDKAGNEVEAIQLALIRAFKSGLKSPASLSDVQFQAQALCRAVQKVASTARTGITKPPSSLAVLSDEIWDFAFALGSAAAG